MLTNIAFARANARFERRARATARATLTAGPRFGFTRADVLVMLLRAMR